MSRRALLVVCLLLLPLSATAGRRERQQLLQATAGHRGWILELQERRARLEATDGARQSFRVRRGERWLDLAESADGWIAAGIHPGKENIELSLVANFGRGTRRLPQPGGRTGSYRTRPVPIVSSQGLQGLAWLEGKTLTELAVRTADFADGGFSLPTTVSAPAGRSQTGLTAAVLADGSWLLAWSRFDGRDDEIFWSRRAADGAWSTPRRLHTNNATPDITPHLLARGEDALIAWSRLDGEYEVVTSSFANGRWSTPRALGVQGSVSPTFRRLEGRGDFLLVRKAWPGAWTAFHLDATGRTSDFAVVVEESPRPPVIRPQAGSALAFEWAGRRGAALLDWEPVQ